MKRKKTGKRARKCWRSAILSRVVRKTSLKEEEKVKQRLKDSDGISYIWRKSFPGRSKKYKDLEGWAHLRC